MKLTKMHGLGNDFILFSDPQGANKDYTDLAIRLCDRRTGIGADGLVIVVPSNTCDVRMRIINSDGSEAEMCGNGIRCFAKYAYEHGEIKDTWDDYCHEWVIIGSHKREFFTDDGFLWSWANIINRGANLLGRLYLTGEKSTRRY